MTEAEFIKKCSILFGYKYDYSKVEYYNPERAVVIVCPVHGEFSKKPYKHVNGAGCPKCEAEAKAIQSSADNILS